MDGENEGSVYIYVQEGSWPGQEVSTCPVGRCLQVCVCVWGGRSEVAAAGTLLCWDHLGHPLVCLEASRAAPGTMKRYHPATSLSL